MIIYIWGTGRLTGKVVDRDLPLEVITGFIDNDESKTEHMGKPVLSPKTIATIQYDAILVCNLYAEEILKQCQSLGIDLDKVICLYNNCHIADVNRDYDFVEKVVGKQFAQKIRERYKIVRGTDAHGDLFLNDCDSKEMLQGYMRTDYVRIKCFELVVKEIRKRRIEGA